MDVIGKTLGNILGKKKSFNVRSGGKKQQKEFPPGSILDRGFFTTYSQGDYLPWEYQRVVSKKGEQARIIDPNSSEISWQGHIKELPNRVRGMKKHYHSSKQLHTPYTEESDEN